MDALNIIVSIILIIHGRIYLLATTAYMKLAEIKGQPYKTTILNGRWDLGAS